MPSAGIRAARPVSIAPRRFISTVEGGPSLAHTAYIGWSKPVRVVQKLSTPHNRQKTELVATQVCGPLQRSRPRAASHAHPTKSQTKITLHLPKESVMQGGTSLSKNSPSVIKMDRSFRYTFESVQHHDASASPRKEQATPRRQPVARHFQQTAQQPSAGLPTWLSHNVERIRVQEAMVESPRMQRLIKEHPCMNLDCKPARLPCSVLPQKATLGAFATAPLPYNPEFLWLHTDPTYKYRSDVPLSPRSKKKYGPVPTIEPLRQQREWDADNVSHSRMTYCKQMGNPKVLKLECTQNGFFDASIVSTDQAELQIKKREHARKLGMEKMLEEGRRELSALMVSPIHPLSLILYLQPGVKCPL